MAGRLTGAGAAGVAAVATAAAAVVVGQRHRRRPDEGAGSPREARTRWQAVTVLADPNDVYSGGHKPPFLADLGEDVEVEVRAAAGDKGTELRARLRQPASSKKSADEAAKTIRMALRRAKQVIEAGEVLRVDPTPHGERKATPTGALVDRATAHADEEGLL
ncbi:hypothetical protein [Frondihabitans sp. VKM Ac-2883]|uniref:hypothetical protein n=1 Tax=Frondihabitans sp. VKM Ac-2883 TaxID=2783823 RepID=UPI00188B303D|nr:hypothetical protein [Frondihabitans sp. VKM Ac-2883]MBF4575491.1 hypothetical protein [Frondihabitans sp. VKM Ac-2883]